MTEQQRLCFEAWYHTYYAAIYRYFLKRTGSRPDTEDLTQTTFMKVWRSMDTYDAGRIPVNAWLFTIAANCLKDHYKTRKPADSFDAMAETGACTAEDDTAQTALSLLEDRDLLRRALETLPGRSREIVILKYFGALSAQEIAQVADISENYVRVLLCRALDHMQRYLERCERERA